MIRQSVHQKILFILPFTVFAASCASSGGSSKSDARENMQRLSGAKVAMPAAVVLNDIAADGDGLISLAKIEEAAPAMLGRFDLDGSGTLSQTEYVRWAEVMLGDPYGNPSFLAMDRDGNMGVTAKEFSDFFTQSAERFDKNGDGLVSREELFFQLPSMGRQGASQADMRSMMQQQGGGRPGGGGGRSGGGRPPM